jgi:hypothetical protein
MKKDRYFILSILSKFMFFLFVTFRVNSWLK